MIDLTFRVVIVKDRPDNWRRYRWSVEEKKHDGWGAVADGRACSRWGARRKAHRHAESCPWRLLREEMLVRSRIDLPHYEPKPATPGPLPSELIGAEL